VVLQGADGVELALCYFKSNKESNNSPRGFLYLKDIVEVKEDGSSFTLQTPARCVLRTRGTACSCGVNRTMRLSAQTRAQHRLWAKSIIELCPHAKVKSVNGEQYTPSTQCSSHMLTAFAAASEKVALDK
jgi:hypothetical protein